MSGPLTVSLPFADLRQGLEVLRDMVAERQRLLHRISSGTLPAGMTIDQARRLVRYLNGQIRRLIRFLEAAHDPGAAG